MYAINKTNGIGEVVSQDENTYTIYFEETDKTSKLLKDMVKVYASIEDAERALNPELTNEEKISIYNEVKKEQEIMRAGVAAQHRLEEIQIETSKRLMRNI